MPLFSKRYAGSTWRHRLRGRLFAVGCILSAGCIIWAFAGHEPEGSISTWSCGMVVLLITGFLTQPPSSKQRYVEPVPEGGIQQTNCWKCDYDLRSNTERCPECGERIYSPLEPLDYPENFKRDGPRWGSRLEAYVCRRLLARSQPTLRIWGDDPVRRNVADVVCKSAWRACGWPNPWFLPTDRFGLMVVDREMGVLDTYYRIACALGIHRQKMDMTRMLKMNLGEAVDYLIHEVGVHPTMADDATTPTMSSQ